MGLLDKNLVDLPTCLYLIVLVGNQLAVWKYARIFSKYRHRVSGKYGNRDVNDASSLPAKPIVER